MNYRDLINTGTKQLIDAGIDEKTAKQDSELLFLFSFHLSRTELVKNYKTEVNSLNNNLNIDIYKRNIKERANGKPLSYITHSVIFFNYDFFVNESTLIPRVDSEVIVEQAINFIKNCKEINQKIKDGLNIKILDACCGSGCLGLSLTKYVLDKKFFPAEKIELTLLDISSTAMQVAKINIQKVIKNNVIVKCLISDVLVNGFGNEKYDIILCNPPYIKQLEIENLENSVKNFEPHLALDGGLDGLKFYKSISLILHKNLFKHSVAIFEIGFDQNVSCSKIFNNANFCIQVKKDYGNQDRCLICRLK